MHTHLNEMSCLLQGEIFKFLTDNPHSKLNKVFAHLKQNNLLPELDKNPEQNLFKHNFIVMNALFNLQTEVRHLGYSLSIDSIFIKLDPYSKNQISTPQNSLASYYLDFSNFDIDSHKVEDLLNSFWQRYLTFQPASESDISNALKALGLTKEASLKDVKQAWYKIALTKHPDKLSIGDDTEFKAANNAYQILAKHFKSKDRNYD